MSNIHILISGDYWHDDFRSLLSEIDAPTTLVPLAALDSFENGEADFALIILAQTRRDQIDSASVEGLRIRFPGTPVVNLLGSWCEGSARSGQPHAGVVRVYWHQWQGRYDQFISQLTSQNVTDWHQPLTANIADRIEASVAPEVEMAGKLPGAIVGISAETREDYDMLRDGVESLGWSSRWLERAVWDGAALELLTAICIEARSLTKEVRNRIRWLKSTFPGVPQILVLNFPRTDEFDDSAALGVNRIVSKPFELSDLKSAIDAARTEAQQRKSLH